MDQPNGPSYIAPECKCTPNFGENWLKGIFSGMELIKFRKIVRSVFYLQTSWEKIKSFGKLGNKLFSPIS